MDYQEFLSSKSGIESNDGFEPMVMPDYLYDFQKHLTEWSIKKGRSAIFADCGLGKTPMQLVWAENIVRKTNRPVLILTPLAVSAKTVQENSTDTGRISTGVQGFEAIGEDPRWKPGS